MKQALSELFRSKKFLLTLTAILVLLLGKIGLDVDEGAVEGVVYLIGLLIAGQSLTDFGKGQTQALLAARPPTQPPPSDD